METKKGRAFNQSSHAVTDSTSASQRPLHQVAIARLIRLLAAHPWTFWGGVGSSLALVMLVSLSSLLSPNSPGRVASGAAYGVSNQKTTPQELSQRHRVPVWLFGAIALTCTAGSLMVSKQLSRTAPVQRPSQAKMRPLRRKAPQRLKPYSAIDAPLPKRLTPQPNLHPPLPAAPQSTPTRSMREMPSFAISAQPPNFRASSVTPSGPVPAPPPQVTVVPEAEAHPLDWGLASLADALDLRQQRSLDSWLDDPNYDRRRP